MFSKIVKRIIYPNSCSSKKFIEYLRKKGIKFGKNCYIWSPNRVLIDVQQPYLLEFGDYVKITEGVKILAHDYSVSVLRRKYKTNIGQAKKTIIGNNVFIGMNAIILPGTIIGDNTIIGAGSVVSGKHDGNEVIAGNPATMVCSIEEFYNKKKKNELDNAVFYAKKFFEHNGRYPNVQEMGNAFAWLYLPRDDSTIYRYDSLFHLNGDNYEEIIEDFKLSKPQFNGFDEFIEYVEKENELDE